MTEEVRDERLLVQVFAQTVADDVMTLGELNQAWDRICRPVLGSVSADTVSELAAIYETNRRVHSGA